MPDEPLSHTIATAAEFARKGQPPTADELEEWVGRAQETEGECKALRADWFALRDARADAQRRLRVIRRACAGGTVR